MAVFDHFRKIVELEAVIEADVDMIADRVASSRPCAHQEFAGWRACRSFMVDGDPVIEKT